MLISTVFRKLKRLPIRHRGASFRRRSRRHAASPSQVLEQRQMLDATLPQLVADSYAFRLNGTTKQLDVLSNDTPGDSGPLQIEAVSQGNRGGFVQIAPDRQSLIYQPFAGAHGVETFHYAVTGGTTGEVTVRLRESVEDDQYPVDEQTGVFRLNVLANDDLGSRFTGARLASAVSLASIGGTVQIAEDGVASLAATIEIVNRVLEIDLTDVPDADASVIRDKQAGQLVVRYGSTSLDTGFVEQRFSLETVGSLRVTLGGGNDQLDLSRAFRRSTVFGGAGNDSIIGGARYDELHGEAGDDVLQGRRGVDLLFGEDGDDQLYGQQYNDWIYGGAGNDTLLGNDGNDVLNGGTGADFLNGGRGRNRLTDQINGNVLFDAAGYDTGRGDVARGIGPNGRLEIIGGDDDQILNASRFRGDSVILNGGGGNDTLAGSRGDDSLDGGAGNDVIRGGAGQDTLFGGDGNDRLMGQGGIDELGGGLGDDVIDGGDGLSVVREQADTNYSLAGGRSGITTSGLGTDVWIGGYFRAVLDGGDSDNVIDAGMFNGKVLIRGHGGNDILAARRIRDEIHGDEGIDVAIFGGTGQRNIEVFSDTRPRQQHLGPLRRDELRNAALDVAQRANTGLGDVRLVSVGPIGEVLFPGTSSEAPTMRAGSHLFFEADGTFYRYAAAAEGARQIAFLNESSPTTSNGVQISQAVASALSAIFQLEVRSDAS